MSRLDRWLTPAAEDLWRRGAANPATSATPSPNARFAQASGLATALLPAATSLHAGAAGPCVATGSSPPATWRSAENRSAAGEVAEVARLAGHRTQHPSDGTATLAAWRQGAERLQTLPPPADVPPGRWRQVQQDALQFCEEWGEKAVALGWSTLDAFGAHKLKPYARLDAAGLVWFLGRCRVLALGPDSATLQFPSGSRQTYRCRRNPELDAQRIPAWELAQ
jgi:hypothetical protein